MQTLAPPISVRFTPEISATLRRKAKEQKVTLPKIVAAIVEDYMDEISDEEDKRLSELVDERARTATKFISHEEAWA